MNLLTITKNEGPNATTIQVEYNDVHKSKGWWSLRSATKYANNKFPGWGKLEIGTATEPRFVRVMGANGKPSQWRRKNA
jgi:hypothetical protein